MLDSHRVRVLLFQEPKKHTCSDSWAQNCPEEKTKPLLVIHNLQILNNDWFLCQGRGNQAAWCLPAAYQCKGVWAPFNWDAKVDRESLQPLRGVLDPPRHSDPRYELSEPVERSDRLISWGSWWVLAIAVQDQSSLPTSFDYVCRVPIFHQKQCKAW